MQRTHPYLQQHNGTQQFHHSHKRGFWLDLRGKLYTGWGHGHRKLPDSLAPHYKARMEMKAVQRLLFHIVVRVLYVGLIVALLVAAVGCSSGNAPTAPVVKTCPAGYVLRPAGVFPCVAIQP